MDVYIDSEDCSLSLSVVHFYTNYRPVWLNIVQFGLKPSTLVRPSALLTIYFHPFGPDSLILAEWNREKTVTRIRNIIILVLKSLKGLFLHWFGFF